MRLIHTRLLKADYHSLDKTAQKLLAEVEALEIPPRKLCAEAVQKIDEAHQQAIQKIEEDFWKVSHGLHEQSSKLWSESVYAGADWLSPIWQNWSPDPSPEFATRIGTLTIKAEDLRSVFPETDFSFQLPALIPFAEGRCLFIKATGKAKETAANALLSVMVRVLANTPPGKARFTLIDPVGLGQNVADFLHLGDLNKDLISGKAWSEPQHIEQQLATLTEHMETVIQTCLRKEFSSVRDYNRERQEVAQPFRFLIVNDFPVNFTDASARRLVSIVKNGPRCGVFTFIMCDTDKALPYKFDVRDLADSATQITCLHPAEEKEYASRFAWEGNDFEGFELLLDAAPPQALATSIVKKSGELAIPAMKVDVAFEKLLAVACLGQNSWWSASAAECLRIPLGPAGSRALQELTLGGEQEAHALMVGRTGSGKTNLMHIIITTMALKYPPDEVQLYLIDFKGGVGFKRYAEHRLPHAKVIAIESEREFGMSVLRDLDAELKRRSEAFRISGVDNLTTYRGKMGSENPNASPMPRILLVVDEFHEFFADNDDLAQQAKTIFERLARQGRSYGLHFLLATQSLAGSAQLPSSIMGQIKVRIALPCSEADSRLILADDNKAARALSLPGEAIYNPLGGLVEGNNRFQVARFSDNDVSKYLTAIGEANRNGQAPIIFEGNELAHIEDCTPLNELILAADWLPRSKSTDVFLGEPIAILPPVTGRLRRQSGANLMILARDESEGVGMCLAALVSILAQQQPGMTRVFIADFSTADSEWAGHVEEIAGCFPGEFTLVRRQREVSSMLASAAKELHVRSEDSSSPVSIYLVLQGMHRIKSLREDTEDEGGNNSVELLKSILRDGPEVGLHVIAWADTWGNATRGLDRRALGEFGLRVGTVMDSGDSMNFLDSLAASKISKPHRAMFYDEDRPGQLVTFRPYAMPSLPWLRQAGQRLKAYIPQYKGVSFCLRKQFCCKGLTSAA
jgi:energy-coupling factor transporter ATP-binding protein EcfA2